VSRAASRPAPMPAPSLPDDLPGENDLVRVLFHGRDDEALEILAGDRVVYLLPWAARAGGLAGFEQRDGARTPRPVEFTGDEVRRLLEAHDVKRVPLAVSPARLLASRDGGPPVSWHARVRWADRVEAVADPAPAIRAAFEDGLQVGVPRGYGRLYPPKDAVVTYVGRAPDDPLVITTVYTVDDVDADDDLGSDHLARCAVCEGLLDPTAGDTCPWCSARRRRPWRPRLPSAEDAP